jgi:hypothetical protein
VLGLQFEPAQTTLLRPGLRVSTTASVSKLVKASTEIFSTGRPPLAGVYVRPSETSKLSYLTLCGSDGPRFRVGTLGAGLPI